MKKLITVISLFITVVSFSQVPELISYRAIALDGSGSVLSNTHIKVKISILNNAMSAIFVESHDINPTDINGAYNLQIGASSVPLSGVFNTIDWGNSSKHLKVEIDPTGTGGSYPVLVGTTQLLSVPYALMAKNVMNVPANGVATINNVSDLKNYLDYTDEKVVFVKGYYTPGDGGEGFFIYKQAEALPDNEGVIIIPNPAPVSGNGRWVRQYSGYINVNYFGVKRNYTFPTSDKIQKIIDFASLNNLYNTRSDMTIYFPNGEYFIDKPLVLKDRVKILGGPATLFTPFNGSSYDYMIKIGSGPIVNCEINNLLINLNNTPNMGGIHFKGIGTPTGGIWSSNFKNITIKKLKGNGIYLEGGRGSEELPNQFLVFENVTVERSDENFNSLKMTGQNAQITFLNCTFDGIKTRGANVLISKKDPTDLAPAVVSFINCTIQSSLYGVVTDEANSITFDNCWFEDLDYSFDIKNSKNINILNNRFANAAGFGSEPSLITLATFPDPQPRGICISVSNSFVNVENSYVTVTDPNSTAAHNEFFILGFGTNNVINAKNNSFADIRLSDTFGIMQIITTINSNKIDLSGKKLIFISTSGTINRIDSTVSAGETIFIRANIGSITFSPMDILGKMNKNIYLNGRASLILTQGQGATFIKIDNQVGDEKATYQLVSIAN